jgi:GDP-L-fucose synthase
MRLKDKRVLLTGGSGFLGRIVKRKLEQKGAKVFAPRSYEMNLLDFQNVQNYFDGIQPELVIHSAALYGGLGINKNSPADIFYENTVMYANILECASLWSDKIVCVGTACSYPDGLDILKEEDLWKGPVHKSVQNYGGVKKMMQIGLESYHTQYGMDGIHVLLANLYGPWDSYNPERSHVVAALIRKFVEAYWGGEDVTCWGTGKPIREFLYVEDAAEGIIRAIEEYDDIEPLNIGTGIGTSIKELTELIAKITGMTEDKIHWDSDKPDGQYKKIFDVSKMKEVLNWEPQTSLKEGLIETIEWFKTNYDEAIKRW